MGLETSYTSKIVHNFDIQIEIRQCSIGQVNYFFNFLKSTILKLILKSHEILLNLYESPKYVIYIAGKVISIAFQSCISYVWEFPTSLVLTKTVKTGISHIFL